MAVLPYTELEAVNLILRNMGEARVNSLLNPPLDASEALGTLREISLEVQKRGWYFNTEFHRFPPDTSGLIALPKNTLDVKSAGPDRALKVTIRGEHLYRLEAYNNGPVFIGPVHVRLILGLDFDDLPASARSYIAIRAARVAQIRSVGDQMSAQEDNADETRALAELHSEQLSNERLSLRNSSGVSQGLSGGVFVLGQ
ncbi:hypothetical protein [Rhizobium sp. Leaf341]|uniref:hypothetical protein n=1 Tax=Rhizobium sp. Leaf341 TaxID=1736344 RepID=UPI0007136AEE|nr:hypothetical protein [Rhizobium sp. Leaf341]KQR67869.1 hypothetical protein ASG03_10135 [Rhizobium sp. Leaf341]